MLTHPTRDRLVELGLHGMARAFDDLAAQPETRSLEHADWLALLLEREAVVRRQKRFETRARAARLRHAASVEDVDYRSARGLDRNLFLKLATCEWIRDRQGLLLTGPAGVGKSWLACALGQKACREDLSVAYHRAPRLFAELAVARGERRYARMLQALARVELLIIDDWGPEKLQDDQRRDLLEILEDRYERRSTLVTSQVPVDLRSRDHRQPHHRRRRARPPGPQRPPHRTQGREPPQAPPRPDQSRRRLTRGRRAGKHHHDPGDLTRLAAFRSEGQPA